MAGSALRPPRPGREIMRVALLKDPEVRARIVQPLPDAPPVASAPADGGGAATTSTST